MRVQRHDERLVPRRLPAQLFVLAAAAAIARHDQQAAVEDERSAEAMLAVERKLAVGPGHGAVEIERGEAAIAEAGKDPTSVGYRRRRRVGVLRLLARRLLGEHLPFPEDRAGTTVERDYVTGAPALARRRDEDTAGPDDRRGPAFAVNWRAPQDGSLRVPFHRQADLLARALAGGPAKARPRVGGDWSRACDDGDRGAAIRHVNPVGLCHSAIPPWHLPGRRC